MVQLGRDIVRARGAVNESLALRGRRSPATRVARAHLDFLQKRARALFR
ncbi:hypothetical protein QDW16_gp14 [Microbacterium phage Quenya]|nr:hypothetical protein QDW16_gp14 [Microbacterium phage Quenya]QOP64290.1 hypothetical protein SEA_QUENYA_55 [Microbacterium phage Quenya]